jgi:hypothetical protein
MWRRMLEAVMKRIEHQSMSIDELWTLHQEIGSKLATKLEAEQRKLQNRLDELAQKFTPAFDEETAAPSVPQGFSEIPEPRAAVADVGG